MLTILSLNINDFGGKNDHLMEYTKLNWQKREVIDWVAWRKMVNKEPAVSAILQYIKEENPDIAFIQEFEVNNCLESKSFVAKMEEMGYRMLNSIPTFKASISVVFAKIECVLLDSPNTLNLRSYAVQIGDVIVYGVHVPPKGRDRIVTFWDEIDCFYRRHQKENVLLLGDFNTVNAINMERYRQLLAGGAVDVWLKKGYADDVPTCGNLRMDIAVASPMLLPRVSDITICSRLLNKGMTDHAALIVDIEENEEATAAWHDK